MNKITCILALFLSTLLSLQAQETPSPEDRARADAFILRLINALDNAQEVQRFAITRDSLTKTLVAINEFVQKKNVQQHHYNNLKAAYSEAQMLYMANLNQLRSSLSSLARTAANTQDLRRALMTWIDQLNPEFTEPFNAINNIRVNRMQPLLDSIRRDAGVKAMPFIPMIIAGLIQYGPEVMQLLRTFEGDQRNFRLVVMRYVVERMADRWFVRLTQRMELPSWESKVAPFTAYLPLIPPAPPSPPAPPAPVDNNIQVLVDKDYNEQGNIQGTDGRPAITLANGVMTVHPLNFRQGSFPRQNNYRIQTSILLRPYERNGKWLPECQAVIWNGIADATDLLTTGNYITVLRSGSGYILSIGSFSQSYVTGSNGRRSIRRVFTQTNQAPLPATFDPAGMQNLTINCNPSNSTIRLGNTELSMNHTAANSNTIVYAFYNGTNTFAAANAPRADHVLQVDYLHVSSSRPDLDAQMPSERSIREANGVKYHVVCVGVSNYQDNALRLNFAEKDARAMQAIFGTYNRANVQTYLLTDRAATHNAILDTLRRALNNARPQDVLLFYFSGHGEEGGLVPHDYDRNNPQTLLQFSEIMGVLNQKKLRVKGLLLDACHSGSIGPALISASKDAGAFDRMNQVVNTLQNGQVFGLCSSAASQPSWEHPAYEHGVFTYYLLSALQKADFDNSGLISLGEVNWYLKNTMNRRQSQTYQLTGRIQFRMPLFAK